MVIGSRFCKGNGGEIPAYRKVGMKVMDIVTNFLGGLFVLRVLCGSFGFYSVVLAYDYRFSTYLKIWHYHA
jgi:hypothetical protein